MNRWSAAPLRDDDTRLAASSANEIVIGWTPDGRHVLFTSDRTGSTSLWAQRIIGGKPSSEPVLIKEDIRPSAMGMTRSGALYYSVTLSQQDVYIASYDFAAGTAIARQSRVAQRYVGFNSSPAWSRDGTHLAYLSQRGPSTYLIVRSIDTGMEREFKPDFGDYVVGPVWSPAGAVTVAGRDRDGRWGIYNLDSQSGASRRLFANESGTPSPLAWSPDARTLYLERWPENNGLRVIVARDLQSGHEREIVRATPDAVAVSPDSRFLALTDRTSNDASLLIVPLEGGTPRNLLRVHNPETLGFVTWSADGAFLIFAKVVQQGGNARREFMRVPAAGGEAVRIELGPDFTDIQGVSLRIHPDGRRFAFNTLRQPRSEIWALENFLPVSAAAR